MKLFVSTKTLIDKTKNGKNESSFEVVEIENEPSLEIIEVLLVQSDLVDNECQQKVWNIIHFMPNRSYAYLPNVETSNLKIYAGLGSPRGQGGLPSPPPTFWLLMFFIINDSKMKLKKCRNVKFEKLRFTIACVKSL